MSGIVYQEGFDDGVKSMAPLLSRCKVLLKAAKEVERHHTRGEMWSEYTDPLSLDEMMRAVQNLEPHLNAVLPEKE